MQVEVLASGRDIVTPATEVVNELAQDGKERATETQEHVDLAWNAVIRLLDQKDPSYRQ